MRAETYRERRAAAVACWRGDGTLLAFAAASGRTNSPASVLQRPPASRDNELTSFGPEEFRVGPFFAEAGIVERCPLKGAAPAAWLAVAGEGGHQGGVNG